MDLWCEYHKEHEHTLSQSRELKKVLDRLADEGKLDRYLKRDNSRPRGPQEDIRQRNIRRSNGNDQQSDATEGIIYMISGGYSEYYPSNRSIKDSVHTLKFMTAKDKRAVDGPKMIFGEVSQPIQHPHSDPIVLTIKVGFMNVRRVLADTGSTTDLITMDCLKQLKYGSEQLEKLELPLVGFGGNGVCPSGTILLPVRF